MVFIRCNRYNEYLRYTVAKMDLKKIYGFYFLSSHIPRFEIKDKGFKMSSLLYVGYRLHLYLGRVKHG